MLGLALSACAAEPAPQSVVVLPPPQPEPVAKEEPRERDQQWLDDEVVAEADERCSGLASSVDAQAAWMNPNMLRLELGTPAEGASYSDSEPLNLVGASLRSKTMTRERTVMFLNLSTFRIGVLANVPLECGGATKRIRVMVMPNSGKLQFGGELHVVRKDVP